MPVSKWVLTFTILIAAPAAAQSVPRPSSVVYEPPSGGERAKFFVKSVVGPKSIFFSGPMASAMRTYSNRPEEWGPGWEGFGKRYGIRFVNNAVLNGTEVALGALWGEDPRYQRAAEGSTVKRRLGHAMKQVLMNRYSDGQYRIGVAKMAGITTGAFAQNLWMPDSIATKEDAARRVGGAYAGRAVSNLFREFGPDLRRLLRRKKN